MSKTVWVNMMRFLSKIGKLILSRTTLGIVLFLLCVDMLLEGFGLPAFIRNRICSRARDYGAELHINQLCVGIFRGLVSRGVTFQCETEFGLLSITADDVVIDLSPIGLLSSDVPIEKVNVKNLSFDLGLQPDEVLYELHADELLFLTPHYSKGYLHFDSTINGIRCDFSADILNLGSFLSMVNELANRPSSEEKGRNEAVCKALKSIAENMRQMDFIREDTSITLESVLDCAQPKNALLQGSFSLSDAIFRDVVISRLRGKLAFKDGTASLEDLMLLISTGDILRANARFDVENTTLSCELDGNIAPYTIIKMLGGDSKSFPQFLSLHKSFRYHGSLKDYPLALFPSDKSMSWEISGFELGSLPIESISCELSFHDGVVGFHEITIIPEKESIIPEKEMKIYGKLDYFTQDNSLALEMEGKLLPASLMKAAHIELPESIAFDLSSSMSFDISLPKSPIKPETWELKCDFSLQRQRLAYWAISELKGTLELKKGILRIPDLTCKVEVEELASTQSDNKRLSLGLELDLNKLLTAGNNAFNGQLELHHRLALELPKKNTEEKAFAWEGVLTYQTEEKTLALDGRGSTFLDWIYKELLANSKISGTEYFAPFFSTTLPQKFSIQIPAFKINAPHECRVEVQIDGNECGYGTFSAKEAGTKLVLNAERLVFTEIHGTTQEKYETSLKIEIQFAPFFLKITDLDLKGDPMAAVAFIMSNEAKEIYQRIWRECEWDSKDMPHILIPMIYYTSDTLGGNWEFKLDGNIQASHASYRGQEFSNLECGIALTLPGELDLKPIKVVIGEAEMEGECNIRFFGSIPCNFKVSGKKGLIKPALFLSMIDPSLRESLETLTFQDDTQFACSGSFFLDGATSLEVKGNVQSPQCSFLDWTFSNVITNWSYENNQAFWHTQQASFMGGDFKTTGVHNILTHTSDLVCTGQNMSWEQLLKTVFKEKKEEYNGAPGVFNFTCNLQLKQGWAGHPYQMGGDGHFSLKKADLWQLPLMKQLSRLVEVTTFKLFSNKKNDAKSSTFGSITAIKANAEFHGPRVVVTDFNTDGTIIALSGEGEYNILNKKLHFEVNGSPLKEVTILSTLLKPLAWCFNAELDGTASDAKWKMKTALSKIFSTDD